VTERVRIGTRGSRLALVQSNWVRAWLERTYPGLPVELVTIKTSGDRFVDQPLSTLGGKGLFVKEIEEALASHAVDCAVHSMKDVPNELLPGLTLAAIPPREDPRDVLIARGCRNLHELPDGARVGTSSLRRMALLRAARPHLDVCALRGNVDSRLRKLEGGELDAIVLAAAGLRRLGVERAETVFLDPAQFVPAIGQGALAIETRADDLAGLLAPLDDPVTRLTVTAERAFLRRVGGSCRTPLAAHATMDDDSIALRALIASPDGQEVITGTARGPHREASRLGVSLADDLLGRGGARILAALESAAATHAG
jgi:hydroxymethylbilane synthase